MVGRAAQPSIGVGWERWERQPRDGSTSERHVEMRGKLREAGESSGDTRKNRQDMGHTGISSDEHDHAQADVQRGLSGPKLQQYT